VLIDAAFEKFVRSKIGDKGYENIRKKNKNMMMQDFDQQVKMNFAGEDRMRCIELKGVEDNAAEGIVDGTILLSG